MHDYPNNAALTSVINAIDTNKADKVDIPRIDTTLSAAGAAADAKAVGDTIKNIELTPGPKGDSGVYVGTEEPADDSVNVWINPEENDVIYPSGGGNISYHETELTMEEDVVEIMVDLPAQAKDFFLWNMVCVTPDTGSTETRTLQVHVGGSIVSSNQTTPSCCSVNITGLQFSDYVSIGFNKRDDMNSKRTTTKIGGDGYAQPGDGNTTIGLYAANNSVMFPAGTSIRFWGVYHK